MGRSRTLLLAVDGLDEHDLETLRHAAGNTGGAGANGAAGPARPADGDTRFPALARTVLTGMTELRIRHVPVVVDGRLTAIVSIGDVVKHRITDLQAERDQLSAYIQQ